MNMRINHSTKGDFFEDEADGKIKQEAARTRPKLSGGQCQRMFLQQSGAGHDSAADDACRAQANQKRFPGFFFEMAEAESSRSEEHTSELQSLRHLVCRL